VAVLVVAKVLDVVLLLEVLSGEGREATTPAFDVGVAAAAGSSVRLRAKFGQQVLLFQQFTAAGRREWAVDVRFC
jgi:hypothetical protein